MRRRKGTGKCDHNHTPGAWPAKRGHPCRDSAHLYFAVACKLYGQGLYTRMAGMPWWGSATSCRGPTPPFFHPCPPCSPGKTKGAPGGEKREKWSGTRMGEGQFWVWAASGRQASQHTITRLTNREGVQSSLCLVLAWPEQSFPGLGRQKPRHAFWTDHFAFRTIYRSRFSDKVRISIYPGARAALFSPPCFCSRHKHYRVDGPGCFLFAPSRISSDSAFASHRLASRIP